MISASDVRNFTGVKNELSDEQIEYFIQQAEKQVWFSGDDADRCVLLLASAMCMERLASEEALAGVDVRVKDMVIGEAHSSNYLLLARAWREEAYAIMRAYSGIAVGKT